MNPSCLRCGCSTTPNEAQVNGDLCYPCVDEIRNPEPVYTGD